MANMGRSCISRMGWGHSPRVRTLCKILDDRASQRLAAFSTHAHSNAFLRPHPSHTSPATAIRSISSTVSRYSKTLPPDAQKHHLTHLTESGAAHMVHIPPPTSTSSPSSPTDADTVAAGTSTKPPTARLAIARCVLRFSNSSVLPLISSSALKKGDALAVARIAGIMGAKKTADLIPLCHNIPLSGVSVDVDTIEPGLATAHCDSSSDVRPVESENVGEFGGVVVTARVHTFGQTGVEMEALTAVSVAGLTVYDMCKAVDRGMSLDSCRVILKEGGKSGRWVEGKHT